MVSVGNTAGSRGQRISEILLAGQDLLLVDPKENEPLMSSCMLLSWCQGESRTSDTQSSDSRQNGG